MFVPGRPTIEQRVLDALSPDARSALLNNKVRASDANLIRKRYHGDASPWPAAFKKEMEFERAFVQAGGLLLAGLDPTGMGGVIAGFGDQREVELLVEAGFTPVEAIHIATANGAQYLGELDRIGTIAVGKQARVLVVIKGDPSKKIEDIENVETVFKDGIGYDSARLIESVSGVVGEPMSAGGRMVEILRGRYRSVPSRRLHAGSCLCLASPAGVFAQCADSVCDAGR